MERIKFYSDQELTAIFYTLEQHTNKATTIYQKKWQFEMKRYIK